MLAPRCRIAAIRHNGAVMTGHPFNQMLKMAAARIASAGLRESLGLDAFEIKDRFGLAAQIARRHTDRPAA